MQPRGKLDIGWSDLFYGARCCIRPPARQSAQQSAERAWSMRGDAIVCLSVRSGFDALLQALAYPAGDEILVSAITIRDMTRIVEHHGLVPVPVDLDMGALSLPTEALDRALTTRTRAILVAHVFGSRMPLDGVIAFARRHGLLVVEDCAQAYAGPEYRGHPESDVVMFSFGPIKTNTALAGAVLTFADPALLNRVRSIQEGYPVQNNRKYLVRLLKYGGLKALTTPAVFSVFAAICRRAGRSHDAVISAALRGFPGPDLFAKLRQQPCGPLLALLARRLTTFDPRRIERRIAAAEKAVALMPDVTRPGTRARDHTHWVFPIQTPDADRLMRTLWDQGFDATRGASSLYVVEPPPNRPDLAPLEARRTMSDLLYLPVYPGVSEGSLRRLARTSRDFAAGERADPIVAGTPIAGPDITAASVARPASFVRSSADDRVW